MEKSRVITSVDKAIRSLFQIILVVDRQGHKMRLRKPENMSLYVYLT